MFIMRRPDATRPASTGRDFGAACDYIREVMTLPHPTSSAAPDRLAAALADKRQRGAPGEITDLSVASGEGWRVQDIVCTCGPRDHEAEERTSASSVALVLSGSFVVRDRHGTSMLSEGSYLLVSAGHCFACSHRHGEGDRCLSFRFEPALFERIAHDAGGTAEFAHNRLAPVRALAPLTARARRAMHEPGLMEEVAIELAGQAVALAGRARRGNVPSPHDGRISAILRYMAAHSAQAHTVASLAAMTRLSPYHFLRSFKSVTGVTPHQWLLRARLRAAAEKLALTRAPVTEIALDVGFEDLSNFTRTFRAEFGTSPRQYRLAA
jgi:AraC-like DNA-binding protein